MRERDQAATLASVTSEGLIEMLAVTARTACRRMTSCQLAALSGSVAQAESLPAKPCWDRKAVAHAEVIGMLGDVTGDPVLIRLAGLAVGWTYDLAVAAGPGADGIILGSRRRLLDHLRAGDAEAAGQEIENHLRVLSFMERLSRGGSGRGGKTAPGRAPRAPRSAA
jgi:GntR family transcriptional regulator, transcriptional repressor for pyruvate dehydrogenase complex